MFTIRDSSGLDIRVWLEKVGKAIFIQLFSCVNVLATFSYSYSSFSSSSSSSSTSLLFFLRFFSFCVFKITLFGC